MPMTKTLLVIDVRLLLQIILLALLISSCSRSAPDPAPTWVQAPVRQTNRILLKPRARFRGTLTELLPTRSIQTSRGIAALGIQILELRSTVNVDQAVRDLRARPEVEFAERDVELPANSVMNDASYGSQWYLPKIDAPGAWVSSAGAGAAVTIAILDTGIDPTHPDLQTHMVAGWNFSRLRSCSLMTRGLGSSRAGSFSGEAYSSGTLRPKRVCAAPMLGSERSL